MSEPLQLRPGQIYHAIKPVRDPAYLRFVKSLPCLNCLKSWSVDPCHTGPHALGRKGCDLLTIPLCRKCHQEFDASPYTFADKHGIDIPARITQFQAFYRKHVKREAA